MRLLAQRVPLTLLLDLAAPPDAEELLFMESSAGDWESFQPGSPAASA